MIQTAQVTDVDYTREEMAQFVARFADQKSCARALLDTRIPGFERDIFSLIGTGVQEDPDLSAPIEAEDFHVAIVRCEPGKGSAMHSHLTQEVLMPLSGRWSIQWGPAGDKTVDLGPLDLISVPIHVMRGFINVSDESAMLLAIVGGHDPGRVGWPQSLKVQASEAGLEIDDDGNLREIGVRAT